MLVNFRVLDKNKACCICGAKDCVKFALDDEKCVCNVCLSDNQLVNLLILRYLSNDNTKLYEKFDICRNTLNDIKKETQKLSKDIKNISEKLKEILE